MAKAYRSQEVAAIVAHTAWKWRLSAGVPHVLVVLLLSCTARKLLTQSVNGCGGGGI